jgi:hypothetical protein
VQVLDPQFPGSGLMNCHGHRQSQSPLYVGQFTYPYRTWKEQRPTGRGRSFDTMLQRWLSLLLNLRSALFPLVAPSPRSTRLQLTGNA